jgi:hypothetical protein
MPRDNKYGQITLEHGTIPEDEPVVVFRARDRFLPRLLEAYYQLCEAGGSPAFHLETIQESIDQANAWQMEHSDEIRTPRSDGHRERVSS